MDSSRRKHSGVATTILTRVKEESYVWNIELPPKFFDIDYPVKDDHFDVGEFKFTTGSLAKTCSLVASAKALRNPNALRVKFRLPKSIDSTRFTMKRSTIETMNQEKVLIARRGITLVPRDVEEDGCLVWEAHYSLINYFQAASITNFLLTFFITVEEGPPGPTPQVKDFSADTWRVEIGSFYESKHSSDIVISCDGKEFPAHRLVLSMASPVFYKMFDTDMKENLEKRMVIEDLDKETVGLLLDWMYFREVKTTLDFENLVGLYKAAHKYEMEPLKSWCGRQIVEKHLNLDNVLELFSLGQVYEEATLLNSAKQIIKSEKRKIFKDPEVFQEFNKNFPAFAHELWVLQ